MIVVVRKTRLLRIAQCDNVPSNPTVSAALSPAFGSRSGSESISTGSTHSSSSSSFSLPQSLSLSNGTTGFENVLGGGNGGGGGSVRQSWPQPAPEQASFMASDAATAAAASETRPPFVEQPVTEISDQELAALGFPIEDGAAAVAAPDTVKDSGGGGGVIDSPFIHFTSREFLFRSLSLVLSFFSLGALKVSAYILAGCEARER